MTLLLEPPYDERKDDVLSSTETPGSTLDPQAVPPPAENAEASHVDEDHAHPVHTLNPDCTREIEVEIPAEEVSREFRKVVRRHQKSLRLPGFRAGKVPESLIRSRFREQIRNDVLESLAPEKTREAIAAKNLVPVSQPQATGMGLEDGKPLNFKVVFEVVPEFSIEGYQDVTVEKPDATLTEEEYNNEIESLRDAHSVMEPVSEDRPLADGDTASLNYTGKILGTLENGEFKPTEEPADQVEGEAGTEPITGKDVLFEVGGRNSLESFNNALRGAKAGAHLSFEIDYPDDFGERRLAGRRVAYELDVNSIKKKILPALDDSFAKEVGNYESFEALSKQLREMMERAKQRRLENETISRLIDALSARFDFPIPESLVEQQLDHRLDRGLRILAAQGMHPDQMRHLDFDRIRADQRDAAVAEVKGALLLDRIADAEKIEVSEADVTAELEEVARSRGESVEAARQRLTAGDGLARIREQLSRDKIGRLLYERLPS